MRPFGPADIADMTGVPPESLREWRHRGLIDGIGDRRSNRWYYDEVDAFQLICARELARENLDLGLAFAALKAARHLLALWCYDGVTPSDVVVFAYFDDNGTRRANCWTADRFEKDAPRRFACCRVIRLNALIAANGERFRRTVGKATRK